MNGKNAFEHGGNLYAAIRKRGGSFAEILDFSANINPLGISEKVRATLHESLESIIHYPDAQCFALKRGISQQYNVAAECVTIGNGAVELMYVLCHMIRPKKILVTAPTFSEYECAARSCGSIIEYFSLDENTDFDIDVQAMIKEITGIEIIFICNPNNPTGRLLENTRIEPLLAAAKRQNTYVVVDESFMDFLLDDNRYTCRGFLKDYDNLIIVHSLTKFYAIPGLRLGFSLANVKITRLLHEGKDPWNVNNLAQDAGVAALEDHNYQVKSKEFIARTKIELYNSLSGIGGLKPYLPSVNFILINVKDTKMTAEELRHAMMNYNILIRDCSNYPGLSSQYIRVAVKRPEQNIQLVETLEKVIGGMV